MEKSIDHRKSKGQSNIHTQNANECLVHLISPSAKKNLLRISFALIFFSNETNDNHNNLLMGCLFLHAFNLLCLGTQHKYTT